MIYSNSSRWYVRWKHELPTRVEITACICWFKLCTGFLKQQICPWTLTSKVDAHTYKNLSRCWKLQSHANMHKFIMRGLTFLRSHACNIPECSLPLPCTFVWQQIVHDSLLRLRGRGLRALLSQWFAGRCLLFGAAFNELCVVRSKRISCRCQLCAWGQSWTRMRERADGRMSRKAKKPHFSWGELP